MLQFPDHIDQVTRLAEVSELRQRVISHNLANVNTPNYRRLDVSFEEDFVKAIQKRSDHQSISPKIVVEEGLEAGMDGNTVDMDTEIGQLHQNSLIFKTYSQILSSYLDTMQRAIRS